MTDIPIACTLSDIAMREREETVLTALAAHVLSIDERPDGYRLDIEPTEEAMAAATGLIAVERRCCPFLRFDLTVEPGSGPVRLTLTGPTGTKEFLMPWIQRWGDIKQRGKV